MPTISPAINSVQSAGRDIYRVSWADIATGDTVVAQGLPGTSRICAAVQIGGTFGGATVTLEASNDNVTFAQITKDINGTALSATAAALFDFVTHAAYVRPVLTGGSANAVDVTLVVRDGD